MKQDKRFYSFNLAVRGTQQDAELWKKRFLALIQDGFESPYISFSINVHTDEDEQEDDDSTE